MADAPRRCLRPGAATGDGYGEKNPRRLRNGYRDRDWPRPMLWLWFVILPEPKRSEPKA
ncbi:hypothetical protein FJ970_32580 (plasmid) [Mesorhizobium sp. B2-1-8]|uniref:hypothetical protein n=1 Tax=unclassified Mesorhizobium TaxID=325217 RepID=UPI0015E46895|nr:MULTISPECIES: hypothetical protein [unclassified Mesorhizobium]MBZ9710368.1 hypothetical protein [Mesorhizobium sp. ESP7-2]UCI23064.1 hypothetical protein FJ970_32580 [Mesorhizobium sp. B2-1-8]